MPLPAQPWCDDPVLRRGPVNEEENEESPDEEDAEEDEARDELEPLED